MPALEDTLKLATELHAGVQDMTGRPYIEHVVWVMDQLPSSAQPDDGHLALLHDSLEDCQPRLREMMAMEMGRTVAEHDLEGLLEFYRHRGYSEYFIAGLRLLTREFWSDMSYIGQIRQIAASGHRGAILVKLTDNRHHSDEERVGRVLPCHRSRVSALQQRYARSKRILMSVVEVP